MLNALIWASSPGSLLIVCILAWWRGAAAEKYGSLVILIANLIANIAMTLTYPRFPGFSMCAIDFALASTLLFIAFKYSSIWLGGAMLLQSIALCLQAFDFVGDGPSITVHYVVNDGISYTMIACLVAGLVGSWRARAARPQPEGRPPQPQGAAISH